MRYFQHYQNVFFKISSAHIGHKTFKSRDQPNLDKVVRCTISWVSDAVKTPVKMSQTFLAWWKYLNLAWPGINSKENHCSVGLLKKCLVNLKNWVYHYDPVRISRDPVKLSFQMFDLVRVQCITESLTPGYWFSIKLAVLMRAKWL